MDMHLCDHIFSTHTPALFSQATGIDASGTHAKVVVSTLISTNADRCVCECEGAWRNKCIFTFKARRYTHAETESNTICKRAFSPNWHRRMGSPINVCVSDIRTHFSHHGPHSIVLPRCLFCLDYHDDYTRNDARIGGSTRQANDDQRSRIASRLVRAF